MKVVLDTNVLVSGLLNPYGVPGEIVRMIGTPRITLCVDARILAEYEEVINRPRFQIDPRKAREFMDCLHHASEVHPAAPLTLSLPDGDDEPFLAVAISAKADCLVTGNRKHYPEKHRRGIKVITPSDFIKLYHKRGTNDS